jgi:hypothetical protein
MEFRLENTSICVKNNKVEICKQIGQEKMEEKKALRLTETVQSAG